MDNKVQNLKRYGITHNFKKYILSSGIYGEYLRLTCVESNKKKPAIYIGDFSLDYLRQLSSIFNSVLTIHEAQNLINNTIESQKITITCEKDMINISLYLLNQDTIFTLIPNSSTPVEITYSPARRLPTRHVYLPPVIVKRPTIHTYVSENRVINNSSYLPTTPLYNTPPRSKNNRILSKTFTQTTPNYYLNSPKREFIEYSIPGSPSSPRIEYSAMPSSGKQINYLDYLPVNETQKISTNYSYNIDNQKITELQNETNKIKGEHQSLKEETNKLITQIQQLKNQILIINEENKKLRESQGVKPNPNEIHEITMLKNEIQRLSNELINMKNERNSYITQYKKAKDYEISLFKSKNEELLKSQIKLEQENNDLKTQIQQLILKNNMEESYNQLLLKSQNNYMLENQQNQEEHILIIRGQIIENNNELEFLSRKICQNGNKKKITLHLLYKATVDSDKAKVFHKKCDNADNSLVLIKSGNGKRFGGFTSCKWKGESEDKKDKNAFIFSLDKMQVYDVIPGEDAIGCYPKYGPIFLGCQIKIYDEAFKNGGTTYLKGLNYETLEDYELTGGLREFEVKEIEVYRVEFEEI